VIANHNFGYGRLAVATAWVDDGKRPVVRAVAAMMPMIIVSMVSMIVVPMVVVIVMAMMTVIVPMAVMILMAMPSIRLAVTNALIAAVEIAVRINRRGLPGQNR
jgi:hypothetical protein